MCCLISSLEEEPNLFLELRMEFSEFILGNWLAKVLGLVIFDMQLFHDSLVFCWLLVEIRQVWFELLSELVLQYVVLEWLQLLANARD